MKQGQVRILNEQQVQQLITAPQTLELIETVFRYWAEGKTVNPVKLSLQIAPYHEGHINSMPSYIEPGDLCGVKVVSVFQDNMRDHQLPTTLGTIILHDPQTGLPYSIMGGTHITDLRTGAVSGVMAKYLAKQNSRVLSVVGAGAQGFTSMEMTMLAIGTIEQVRVCDLSEDRVHSFIEKAKGRFPKATFLQCKSNAEALQGADIVLYATSASAPILEGSNVPEGATVICVSEKLTPKTISMFDGWYVDFTECAIERYNADGRHAAQLRGMPYEDLTQQMVTGEIGEVITGAIPGRQNDKQRLLAASVGMSIEDVICADAVFKAAQRQNLGLVVDFENL